jgi:hypothetical protein
MNNYNRGPIIYLRQKGDFRITLCKPRMRAPR